MTLGMPMTLDTTPKAQCMKEGIDNLDIIKMKKLFYKNIAKECENKPNTERKYFLCFNLFF